MKKKNNKVSHKKQKIAPKKVTSKAPMTPLNDRIIVKPLGQDEMGTMTASGIIIPDTAKDKPEQGTVIAVGPGKYENGHRTPIGVSVGDRVMFSKYGYDEVKIQGTTYFVIAESNVLAVIN